MAPRSISVEFTSPLRPSKGIHEIMRMTLDVQNGMVHKRNKTICICKVLTQNARNSATRKPVTKVKSQVTKTNLRLDR